MDATEAVAGTEGRQAEWEVRSPKNDSRAFDVYAGPGEYAWKIHHGVWGEESVARLISAAPEMSETLGFVVQLLSSEDWQREDARDAVLEQAREALKKAGVL